MTKILPLPVQKNKFGERVADISTEKYYRQILEEVLEARKASIIHDIKKHMYFESCADCLDSYVGEDNEPEELVDIITCCITRLEILGYDESAREKIYQAVNEKNAARGYLEA